MQCCCGLLVLFPLGIVVAALPDDGNLSAKLKHECEKGTFEPSVCQQLQHALHEACTAAGSGHGDCMDLTDGARLLKYTLVGIIAVCALCLALFNVVPLCGYCGARNDNRCCLTVYMGFSLLAVLIFIVELLQHFIEHGSWGFSLSSLVCGCLVPGLGAYYSHKLQELPAVLPEIGAPLLQTYAPMYPPQLAAGPAPTAAQALYVPSAPPLGSA